MNKPLTIFVALVLVCEVAAGHSLTVPFFRDTGSAVQQGGGPATGSAGFIGLQNTTNNPVTIFVVYIQEDLTGKPITQQAVSFLLNARRAVSWRPAQDDPAENEGRPVPNTVAGFDDTGSVLIIWRKSEGGPDALKGRYVEFTSSSSFAHVLF